MLTGYSQAYKSSSGTKTAQEILDEQPRLMRACVSEHSVLAYSKQVRRCNFYPKYRPILIRELYMHALNITSHQDLVCLPIYTEKGKNVMTSRQMLVLICVTSKVI